MRWRAGITAVGSEHNMFCGKGFECIRDVGVGQPFQTPSHFGVDRQPMTAVRALVQPTVPGLVNQQIVLKLERLQVVVKGINDIVPGWVEQKSDFEAV